MKTLCDTLKIAFLIVGTVIGAGFITGKELIRFYGGCFLLPVCFFTATTFAVLSYALLCLGKSRKDMENTKIGFTFDGVRHVVLLITAGAMLAGIDGLQAQVLGVKFPFLSILALFVTLKISKKGVDGLGKCNAVLVPIMLVLFLGGLIARGRFSISLFGDGMGVPLVVLYLSMNVFLASPVLLDAGKKYEKRTFFPATAIAGAVIGVCIFLIMGNLSMIDGAQTADVPVMLLWNSPLFLVVIGVVILLAIFTTLLSSFYPLYCKVAIWQNKTGKILLCLACFLVSRLGLSVIVGKLYPVIGVVGAFYIAHSLVLLRKKRRRLQKIAIHRLLG